MTTVAWLFLVFYVALAALVAGFAMGKRFALHVEQVKALRREGVVLRFVAGQVREPRCVVVPENPNARPS